MNNHQIELQLVRKFIERQQVGSMSWPEEFHGFKDIMATAEKGSLALTKKNFFTPNVYEQCIQLKVGTGTDLCNLSFLDQGITQVVSQVKEVYMSDDEVEALTTMYSYLHKEDSIVYVSRFS